VIAAGRIRIETDEVEKARSFDRFLAKYGDPNWARPRSFHPRLGEVTVYRIAVEQITGKQGPLLPSAEQWPAHDQTKSPGAVPPRRE
jgi:nitroimidazol reductase NimA-like FMN-containing flavoprotein (pyridoxamine 5'-phosphate oxidase superfamily)